MSIIKRIKITVNKEEIFNLGFWEKFLLVSLESVLSFFESEIFLWIIYNCVKSNFNISTWTNVFVSLMKDVNLSHLLQ